MRKNPLDRILKGEPKEQYLSIVPKSCSIYINIYIYIYIYIFLKQPSNLKPTATTPPSPATTKPISTTTQQTHINYTHYQL